MKNEEPDNDNTDVPRNGGNIPQVGSKTGAIQSSGSRVTPPSGLLISSALRDNALTALAEGLTATKTQWDTKEKGLRTDPDHSTRVKSAELILAYAEGRPVERKVNLTGDFNNYDSKLEKLLASPEGMRVAIAAGLVEPLEKPAKARRGTPPISTTDETGI